MKIVINGLGEMGASLALAIKNAHANSEIIGVDRNQATLDKAQRIGLADQVSLDLLSVVADADIIILATPIKVIIETLELLRTAPLKPDVLVMDIGSTKKQVLRAAQPLIDAGIAFVGTHAMAGTQKAGIDAIDGHLYDGAPYFIVADDARSRERAKQILGNLGLKFIDISADQHDAMMAILSDLPHVVAATLMNTAGAALLDNPALPQYAAGGFKDTTRIGGADPQMWTDILLTNREATLAAIDNFTLELDQLKGALEAQDYDQVFDFFAHSRAARHKFEEGF